MASQPSTIFRPICPACGYDLSGIPEGRCPECGTTYTLADLHQTWLMRQMRRQVSPVILLVASCTLAVICPPGQSHYSSDSHDRSNNLWCTIIIGFGLAWLIAARARIFTGRGFLPLWLVLPIAHATGTLLFANRHTAIYDLLWLVGAGWCVAWLAWLLTPGRRWAPLLAVASLFLMGPGIVLGPVLAAAGWWWTPLDDPRAGLSQTYAQYPLTSPEVLPFGWAALAVSIILAAGAVLAACRAGPDAAARTSPT